MPLSNTGGESVHNEGVLCKGGVYNGSTPYLFGDTFCRPAFFVTLAEDL